MRQNQAYDEHGQPRYLRIYDNGGVTLDRYCVVFTQQRDGVCRGLSLNEFGSSFGHFEYHFAIDRPRYSHLGKKIAFDRLPEAAQRTVLADYRELWG